MGVKTDPGLLDLNATSAIQCMPQSLKDFLLLLYALDDRVWAGDYMQSDSQILWIVAQTVISKSVCRRLKFHKSIQPLISTDMVIH